MLKKKKILIVDDEKDVTEMVKMNLEGTGEYEVLAENNAVNVINVVRKFKPDLILMDVMMPEMDGGEIANQIKSDQGVKDTPIVFLTAAVTKEEAILQDNTIGGYPFMAKPVTINELLSCIKKNTE